MRKVFYIVVLSLFVFSAYGQNSGSLKFLGIPVDGTKAQFVTALKAKGFYYSSLSEGYKGQFNGKDVDVYVHTNHNLVDRVYVAFPSTTEEGIRTEFNRLLEQFQNTGKYLALTVNEKIPAEEDISYEITVNNKRYQASFCYFDPERDPVALTHDFMDKFSDFFTEEQIAKMKEFATRLMDVPVDQREGLQAEMLAEMQMMGYGQDENTEPDPEKSLKFLITFIDGASSLADGNVWFMIHHNYGRYNVGLYYDNLHNQAHGEDL